MSSSDTPVPKVLLDADVLSHFITGERPGILADVFGGRLALLDVVEQELSRVWRFGQPLEMFCQVCQIQRLALPEEDDDVLHEYASLRSQGLGAGESACMALARHHAHFIASSNLKDIKSYCQTHQITYYTTMDVLHLAVKGGHMKEPECDVFIGKVLAAKSKLPYTTYRQWRKATGL
ncbi:hypothetical protein [Hymenobacter crusticola]|uniref:PIN domain-containing protein n=1 Tax=Hymenobacter crusticola TaxID=1770526 RepID=A0A243W5P8_9BACT|nr:hypothetical protein [Hymenobacter crusticola]OUJ68985.1 hypothetical protein BXP70_27150 [Hymenobacter crusticola]